MSSQININGLSISFNNGTLTIDGIKGTGMSSKGQTLKLDRNGAVKGNINGDLNVEGNNVKLIINGDVKGDVNAGNVKVEGNVRGDVNAGNVTVRGGINGDVSAAIVNR